MQNLEDDRDLEPELTDDTFHLWGLMHVRPVNLEGDDSHDSHDTFCIKVDGQGGVLTFASALDAEIYCQQLRASGMHGWTRLPLERIDLDRVMAALPNTQRVLMLALGFFASDTNNLLLDEDQTLITPCCRCRIRCSIRCMACRICGFMPKSVRSSNNGGSKSAACITLDEVRRAPPGPIRRWPAAPVKPWPRQR